MSARSDNLPTIGVGKRAIVSGRTGMGKSTLACWLLNRSPQHWVIVNPKHTRAYSGLEDAKILGRFRTGEIDNSVLKHRYTLLNFSGDESAPEALDYVIEYLHNNYSNIGICCDELYTLHSAAGRSGAGLTALLTRGRESKQSFLGLTQRPAWISKFCYSEADYVGSLDVALEDDRKTIRSNSGNDRFLERLEPYYWLWYDVAADRVKKYAPVPQ